MMSRASRKQQSRPAPSQAAAILDIPGGVIDAGVKLQLKGLEHAARTAQGCLAFGARRWQRDVDFWSAVARARSPGDVAALLSEFTRTARHEYLEEANRQMEDFASTATETVSDIRARFEETETAIDHASAQAQAVAV